MNNLIDMRQFARSAGTNILVKAGNDVFHRGDPGACMYIVQSGIIEMVIGDKVIETVGPNEAIGFMSMIDTQPRLSTARVKEESFRLSISAPSASWSTKCRTSPCTSWACSRAASAA